jgi:hypothetical protein
MTSETSPSLPAKVYPAELLDEERRVIASGHARITSAKEGLFEIGLLDEPSEVSESAAFLRCGSQDPERLKSLRHEAAVPFDHFYFVLEGE